MAVGRPWPLQPSWSVAQAALRLAVATSKGLASAEASAPFFIRPRWREVRLNADLFAALPATAGFELFEERLRQSGCCLPAGVDEAGRGPLAGPVVAAAVILPPRYDLPGLADSKKLSARRREQLFGSIRQQAVAVGVGFCSAAEIDRHNILQASLLAMRQAVMRLHPAADALLVDGLQTLALPLPQQALVKGDARCASVAAASIIAKVVRDRIMRVFDRRYPGYGFARHKGYGSAEHRRRIAELGPCPLHRASFRGVREYL